MASVGDVSVTVRLDATALDRLLLLRHLEALVFWANCFVGGVVGALIVGKLT